MYVFNEIICQTFFYENINFNRESLAYCKQLISFVFLENQRNSTDLTFTVVVNGSKVL